MIDISTLKTCVRRLGARWARHAEALRISRELGDSSDRILAEIGITRGDIGVVARGRFGRP